MALIYFYDVTELDKAQLSEGLKATDHHWEFVDEPITLENLNKEAEVISVFVSCTVSREMIEKLPKLKLIACRSTGYNNIDLDAAAEHGVRVVNVPTYGESTVAEYAFTLLLALLRKLPASLEFLNHTIDTTTLMGSDINGKTLGVIGTGHIGQRMIKIAKGFEMRVLAFDPFAKEELARELGFEYAELTDVLAQSDVVSLHAPLTPDNYHLIDEPHLALMKQSAVLINTARGELVDMRALVEALENKQLAGAALDVLEGEQLFNIHEEVGLLRDHNLPRNTGEHGIALMALNKMDNVLITPHNAFNTDGAIGRINKTTCDNITRFWFDDIPNEVKPVKVRMGKLLLVRHAESEWNMIGRWTGRKNVNLSANGFRQATELGRLLADMDIHVNQAYCSEQVRTLETLEVMLSAAQKFGVPFERSDAINERDYGKYTAKNKWDMQRMVGEDEFTKIRRGWDHPVPGGETLKMVYERVVPFYQRKVLPLLAKGDNVLIVAHGNSLRALMKYVEDISDDDVENLEMPFGNILVYSVDELGQSTNKTEAQISTTTTT